MQCPTDHYYWGTLTLKNGMEVTIKYDEETDTHTTVDADGNVVVYKGSTTVGEKGETVTLKATIKDHGEREGVNQTIIARPKVA